MIALVKTLHILCLVVALGAGLTRLVLGKTAAQSADAKPILSPLVARFTSLNYLGLIGLWVTGLWLFAAKYATISLNWALLAKMVVVVAMSLIAATAWLKARRGKPFDPSIGRKLGQVSVGLAGGAVFLATLAFG